MHRNHLWLAFLSLFSIGIAIYSADTVSDIWHYFRLNREVKPNEIHWSVLSRTDEKFHPMGKYLFTVEDREYEGETIFQKEYLNDWAAKEAVGRLKKSALIVFYQRSNPAVSSLENDFPIKKTLYTLFLWILALYFLGLGSYVKKQL